MERLCNMSCSLLVAECFATLEIMIRHGNKARKKDNKTMPIHTDQYKSNGVRNDLTKQSFQVLKHTDRTLPIKRNNHTNTHSNTNTHTNTHTLTNSLAHTLTHRHSLTHT